MHTCQVNQNKEVFLEARAMDTGPQTKINLTEGSVRVTAAEKV